jgi:quinol-cytochrome oxidoreductase complex cytochrome b subunit
MEKPSIPPRQRQGLLTRIRRSIWRQSWPEDDRDRKRLTLNDLILHLHAPTFPERSLKLTYTFALGGLSIMLFLVLAVTGTLLMFAYTPTPEAAYNAMQRLASEVWMGQFVRNLHHWSANMMLVLAALHMLRIFYTAAFHHPRQFNWLLGWFLLILVALSNFTGYLMPWDQLSYWAVTIGTSLITYIPGIGPGLSSAILGGPEVGAATLKNFFALHVIVFPMMIAITVAYHIWRVRKDTITIPRDLNEAPLERRQVKRVTTIPHLVNLELGIGLVFLLLLITGSIFIDAPLLDAADPLHPPNPAKAAWYFMGVQELLLHFHPAIVATVIPLLVALGLFLLPYVDFDETTDENVTGIWFRSRRGRRLALISAVLGVILTIAAVIADEYWLDFATAFSGLPVLVSTGVIPLVVPLILLGAYAWLLRRFGATRTEINLALFTVLVLSFVTLTVIGEFFRGENMTLMFPWEV